MELERVRFQNARIEQTCRSVITYAKLTQRWLVLTNYNIVEFKDCRKLKYDRNEEEI